MRLLKDKIATNIEHPQAQVELNPGGHATEDKSRPTEFDFNLN